MRIVDILSEITFQAGSHRSKDIIWCEFPKDAALLAQFKNRFPHAKWSNSNKSWYITDNTELRIQVGLSPKDNTPKTLAKIHPNNQQAYTNMLNQLQLKAYSPNTSKLYMGEFSQLLLILKHHSVNELSADRLKSYLLYCVNQLKMSESQLHNRINALKFYFEQVLKCTNLFWDIPRPKSPSKLPKVLDARDIKKLFQVTTNAKHRLMLQLCYGMGLRVSEVVKLKVSDIDSKRMQVLIESAKGKKDRYVNLPHSVLEDLRMYYKQYEPKEYLFEGQYGGQYSIRSVQAVFKNGMRLAKINKPVGIHCLRHSYATHLLEHGTDMVYIQKLLGHNDIKTTLLYAKVGRSAVQKIKSPLDF